MFPATTRVNPVGIEQCPYDTWMRRADEIGWVCDSECGLGSADRWGLDQTAGLIT
jgi:hypothetical protein